MKVLITGVAGLLGSRLADWIIENKSEVEVWGFDDLSGGYLENINPKVNFLNINLLLMVIIYQMYSMTRSLIMYFTLQLMLLRVYLHLLAFAN